MLETGRYGVHDVWGLYKLSNVDHDITSPTMKKQNAFSLQECFLSALLLLNMCFSPPLVPL